MTTLVANFTKNYFAGISTWFDNLRTEYNRQREIKKTINELSNLTDRELSDIGITRGDIYHIANDTFSQTKETHNENANLKGWV